MTNLRYLRVGASEVNYATVSLISILQAVQREAESLAQAKNQRFEVVSPGFMEMVEVDSAMIEMALTSLLNNAVKFTPPGGKITVYTERHSAELWIRVKDTGIGIPADQLEDIFKDFYQVAEHMTRKYNGMGLGLSIARAVVVANKGRIWAESEGKDQGACFTISLPMQY